jgi:D-3-phosphoglycerate dehydrogenase
MKVIVTDRRFPNRDPYSDAVEALGGEVVYGEYDSFDELIAGVRDADVVVTFHTPLTRGVIEAMGEAKLILRNGAGFDDVDIKAATEHGIPVSSMRGYSNDEMAEHAITLMLAAARDVVFSDRDLRTSEGWGERRHINHMSGGTFGIVGLGQIGRQVARFAQGLGMELIATDPYLPSDVFDLAGVERVGFDDLLVRADCISLHCQLTAETHQLFSTTEFERMNEDAVLVNVARGPLVDEAALVEAVETGEIYAAGVDVFEREPPTVEDSPVLSSERIICSPHHGGHTPEIAKRCIEMGRNEIVRALTGEQLQLVVNPEALWYRGEVISPHVDA